MPKKKVKHTPSAVRIKQILDDISTINKLKDIIEGDWPIKAGDKVQLNLSAIVNRPGYDKMLPAYRRFCEESEGKIFTAEYDKNVRQSMVCLAEDTTSPKWLFWIGDLVKVN